MYGKHIMVKFNLNDETIAFKRFECGGCRNATKCGALENCTIRSYVSQRVDNMATSQNEKSLEITFNSYNVEELKRAYQTAKRAMRLRAIPQPKIR